MLNTTIMAAIVQVAFSRKSVVFLTPIIWFDDAKPEAKPPPFEFWISTIRHIRIDANTMSSTKKLNILFFFCMFCYNF